MAGTWQGAGGATLLCIVLKHHPGEPSPSIAAFAFYYEGSCYAGHAVTPSVSVATSNQWQCGLVGAGQTHSCAFVSDSLFFPMTLC